MKRKPTPTGLGNFVEPTGPDIDAFMRTHPDGDGLLLLANGEKLRPFAAMTTGQIASLIPGLLPELDVDAYYGINRYKALPGDTIPPGYAARPNVSHLTAAWVDIDFHKAPGGALEMWQVMGDVFRAVERGNIPSPSRYADSGRGLWLFWSVHPVELATPAAVDLLERINRRAVELFVKLGADFHSTNVSRWTRFPGSVNSKAGKRAALLFAYDDKGRPITYTLAELAEAFNVAEEPARAHVFASLPQPIERGEKNPANVAKGIKGWTARARNIAAALVHLSVLRGGFREGTRELACHYLAVHLLRSGTPIPEVLNLLLSPEMFTPALKPGTIHKHVTAAINFPKTVRRHDGTGAPIAQQTIADGLDISPRESQVIRENIGVTFPHRWQNQLHPPAPALSRKEKIAARRERVRAIVAECPELTDRAIEIALREEGHPASLGTVQGDLRALEIERPRRRQRSESQPTLDL